MNKVCLSGKIISMGSINMDLVMFMDRFPEPGETVVTDNFSTFPGGKGGNQAVTASVLGGKVKYFGKLGEDVFSLQLKKALNEREVDTTSILVDKTATAGIAIILVNKQSQNLISFTPGANALLTPEEVRDHKELFETGAIFLSSMEINPETVYESIRVANENGMFIILDPAPAPREKFPEDIPALVNIIKPNETEASLITGIKVNDFVSAELALKSLRRMGFLYPIITLGEQGSIAYIDGKSVRIPPYEVESIDSTAAGDVFSGALAASLATGGNLEEALNFASIAAALCTTVKGAQSSIPPLAQVRALC